MIWRIIHFYVAVSWGTLLGVILFEVSTKGELSRSANAAGHFETSTVMWVTVLLALTFASAMRGAWLEFKP